MNLILLIFLVSFNSYAETLCKNIGTKIVYINGLDTDSQRHIENLRYMKNVLQLASPNKPGKLIRNNIANLDTNTFINSRDIVSKHIDTEMTDSLDAVELYYSQLQQENIGLIPFFLDELGNYLFKRKIPNLNSGWPEQMKKTLLDFKHTLYLSQLGQRQEEVEGQVSFIGSFINQNYRVITYAHSQGSLIDNDVYTALINTESIQNKIDSMLGTVRIGAGTPYVFNPINIEISMQGDAVIQYLKEKLLPHPPENYKNISGIEFDEENHSFDYIYLNHLLNAQYLNLPPNQPGINDNMLEVSAFSLLKVKEKLDLNCKIEGLASVKVTIDPNNRLVAHFDASEVQAAIPNATGRFLWLFGDDQIPTPPLQPGTETFSALTFHTYQSINRFTGSVRIYQTGDTSTVVPFVVDLRRLTGAAELIANLPFTEATGGQSVIHNPSNRYTQLINETLYQFNSLNGQEVATKNLGAPVHSVGVDKDGVLSGIISLPDRDHFSIYKHDFALDETEFIDTAIPKTRPHPFFGTPIANQLSGGVTRQSNGFVYTILNLRELIEFDPASGEMAVIKTFPSDITGHIQYVTDDLFMILNYDDDGADGPEIITFNPETRVVSEQQNIAGIYSHTAPWMSSYDEDSILLHGGCPILEFPGAYYPCVAKINLEGQLEYTATPQFYEGRFFRSIHYNSNSDYVGVYCNDGCKFIRFLYEGETTENAVFGPQ